MPNALLLAGLMLAAVGAVAWVVVIDPRIAARHKARQDDLDRIYDGSDL